MNRISAPLLSLVVLAFSACSFDQHGRDKESLGGVGSNAGVASSARVESNVGAQSALVKRMADGHLDMLPWNEQGDRIPDFSFCGYRLADAKRRRAKPEPKPNDDA